MYDDDEDEEEEDCRKRGVEEEAEDNDDNYFLFFISHDQPRHAVPYNPSDKHKWCSELNSLVTVRAVSYREGDR